ncbi:hypothetical protein SDC9_161649 [bioreactor metagenome]|uniref:Uncharacterized protein n=1 Tax=bioreactor metagenome TaxID=1076179 RepID=A0A645FQ71_9ZZZZ
MVDAYRNRTGFDHPAVHLEEILLGRLEAHERRRDHEQINSGSGEITDVFNHPLGRIVGDLERGRHASGIGRDGCPGELEEHPPREQRPLSGGAADEYAADAETVVMVGQFVDRLKVELSMPVERRRGRRPDGAHKRFIPHKTAHFKIFNSRSAWVKSSISASLRLRYGARRRRLPKPKSSSVALIPASNPPGCLTSKSK